MANTDDSQLNEESGARTYGAKDVHKRRVDRKSRPKPSHADTPSEPEEAEPKRDATRTRFTDMPGLLPENDTEAMSAAEAPPERDGEAEPSPKGSANEPPRAEKKGRLSQLRSKLPTPLANSKPDQATSTAEPVEEPPANHTVQKGRADGSLPAQAEDDAQGPSGEEDANSPTPRTRKVAPKQSAKHKRVRIVLTVVGILAAIAILVGGLFAWNRWYRFDDHADLQGDWYVVGTAVPITIDSSAINLAPEIIYDYELNDRDKTISYTFGPMEGHGGYWFSGDRQYLVIVDDNSAAAQELPADALSQTLRSLGDTKVSDLPQGDGAIAFNRKPAPLAKAEQSIVSRVLSEKAAKDAEEQREAEEQAAAEAAEAGYYGYYYY